MKYIRWNGNSWLIKYRPPLRTNRLSNRLVTLLDWPTSFNQRLFSTLSTISLSPHLPSEKDSEKKNRSESVGSILTVLLLLHSNRLSLSSLPQIFFADTLEFIRRHPSMPRIDLLHKHRINLSDVARILEDC